MEKIITNSNTQQEFQSIETTRFGKLQYGKQELLVFYKGLFGFDNLNEFILIERNNSRPFVWLQSVENPVIAFPLVDPLLFIKDYKIEINSSELEEIDIKEPSEARTFVIATIPSGRPKDISLNLLGPVVINISNRQAIQIILTNSDYTTKFYLIKEEDNGIKEEEQSAAVVEV
ncbi:MAG: flagellar assembly protein FliW [candidate division Zixibacteria bacterium]|nr:flagellar assembly protein FliW [candidate division Zixibacteria bacterium]